MICHFTGQLPRARRLELETRLAALVGDTPAIDTAEVEQALVDTARERDELARDAAGAQTRTPH